MSRDTIFARMRTSLGAKATTDEARRAAVERRLSAHAANLVPERAKTSPADRAAQLAGFLHGQGATVLEVEDPAALPSAIAAYLREQNLPGRLRHGADPFLGALPWPAAPGLERRHGAAQDDDEIGLSRAIAAASETGTLVLASGADNPVTLAFLPATHIVVLAEADIAASYEEAFAAVRARVGPRAMPRTLNFISGPSRTADIGGKLVVGAHGPQRLCVIIVKSTSRPRQSRGFRERT
jgi:L-lactate dehydrogenase complex protein LldG